MKKQNYSENCESEATPRVGFRKYHVQFTLFHDCITARMAMRDAEQLEGKTTGIDCTQSKVLTHETQIAFINSHPTWGFGLFNPLFAIFSVLRVFLRRSDGVKIKLQSKQLQSKFDIPRKSLRYLAPLLQIIHLLTLMR